MKTCSKCNIVKAFSEYYVKDGKTGRLHAQCKLCYREHRVSYYAKHYAKYGDQYRERAKIRRARTKKELQNKMIDYLRDKSCQTCGENDPIVLDFDHLDPSTKTFGIARALSDGLRWEIILNEINKCRILCANCHRKHTAAQQGWYR